MTELLTFPARPVNGGHLDYALPKVGDWSYEPKYNGWRAIVHVPTGTMWNRHGLLLTITAEFATALQLLKRSAFQWLDVEALERRHQLGQGSLIVLDCPASPLTWEQRHQALYDGIVSADIGETLIQTLKPENNSIYIAPAYGEEERDDLWQQLQDVNRCLGCEFYEGLVAKKHDSVYPDQLNSSNQTTSAWMKHRFIK